MALGIAGSLQARSGNRTLLEVAARTAPSGTTVEIFEGLRDLPHFDPDIEEATGTPPAVAALRRGVAAADAVLISTPEYGYSLPGVLKNAIDWLIGSGELENKLVAITAASVHADRGRGGIAALRVPLTAVSARIVGGDPIAKGPGFEAGVRALVEELVRAGTA